MSTFSKIRFNLRLLCLALVCGALVNGCGSSSSEFVATGTDLGPSNGIVFGRVLLDRPADGAVVVLTDLSGNSLGLPSTVVDRTGNFRMPLNLNALPPEFRVRVSLGESSHWDLPLLVDVENYNGDRSIFCNALTTAASLYRARHGVTREQAVAWVKQKFEIPADVDIGFGVDESKRSWFRHSHFLNNATIRGGVSNYLAELVDGQPISGQFGEALAVSVVADVATDLIGKAAGTIAQALGLNIGTAGELDELSQQLSDIQNQINQLDSQLQSDFNQLSSAVEEEIILNSYVTLTTSLETTISDIEVVTQDLITTASNANITNAPFSPSSEVQNLLASVAAYDAQSSLELLAATLLGRNNTLSLLELYYPMLAYQSGVPPLSIEPGMGPVWSTAPTRSNNLIFDPYERFFNFFSLNQVLASNLLVESANLSQDRTTIEEARETLADFQSTLLEESQILGFPLQSDFYLANPQGVFEERAFLPVPDSPSGVIYYMQVQASTEAYVVATSNQSDGTTLYSSDGAQAFLTQTQNFSAPGYGSGWALATVDDLVALYELAGQLNPDNRLEGLASLGFDTDSWNGQAWCYCTDSVSDDESTSDGDPVRGPRPVWMYDLNNNDLYRGDDADNTVDSLFNKSYGYIMVRYQPTTPTTGGYENLVAAGFRPSDAPVLSLSADGTSVKATLESASEDITQFCSWTSSDPNQLEVGSLGTDAGKLKWHPTGGSLQPQTITATLRGMDADTYVAKTFTVSIDVPVPSPLPTRTLKSIVVTPSNYIILNPSNPTPFKATGYYDDNSLADLTGQVTWSLELPNGFEYPRFEATINGSIPGVLIFFTGVITDPSFTVKATLGGVVGETDVIAVTN